jgi:hypothetical protein
VEFIVSVAVVCAEEIKMDNRYKNLKKMNGILRVKHPGISCCSSFTTMQCTDDPSKRVTTAGVDLQCRKTGQFWMLYYPITDFSAEGFHALEDRFSRAINFLLEN